MWRWHFHPTQHLSAIGVEAAHLTATPEGDPQLIFVINGHAVRRSFHIFKTQCDPGVTQGTGVTIEGKGQQLSGGSVDMVENSVIPVPGEAIGDS